MKDVSLESHLHREAGLSDLQVGHLRHFRNLANQDDGDWTDMQRGAGGFGAEYRYQLAMMIYAMSLAHYHHLPAAPAVFKSTMDRLLTKMMHQDAWADWLGFSTSSPISDPTLTKPRPHKWNPVAEENIMYSGHLNAMLALYSWYFQDDKFDKVGSITFSSRLAQFHRTYNFDRTLGGNAMEVHENWLEQNTARYNLQSLNDTIYWQTVANGYMGVACEPNQVFVVCNQFPMMGFRFQDLRKGTNVAEELARSYKAAWARRGFLMPNGEEIHRQWRKSVDTISGPSSPWTYAFLNPIDRDLVQQVYPFVRKSMGRTNADGTYVAYPAYQWSQVREQQAAGGVSLKPAPDQDGFATGSTALLFSEMGDPDIAAFYAYVDKYMSPTWKNGGFYYPRNSRPYDEAGNPTAIGSGVGNAFLAFGRLNVKDGLHAMYNRPWDISVFGQPKIIELDDIDVSRARFIPECNTLLLSVKAYPGSARKTSDLLIANAARTGEWQLTINGDSVARGSGNEIATSTLPVLEFEATSLRMQVPIGGGADINLAWN